MYHVLVQLMMGKTACSMFSVLRHLVTDVVELLTELRRCRSDLSSNTVQGYGNKRKPQRGGGIWSQKPMYTLHIVCCHLLAATGSACPFQQHSALLCLFTS